MIIGAPKMKGSALEIDCTTQSTSSSMDLVFKC